MKPIAIGTDDFKEIIENDYLFIDKTLFIKELIDDGSKALLFPRPRRFGKTLNLSMLDYYFNNTYDSKDLFQGLNISKCDNKYLREMNKYPVINFSLKECKKDTYEEFISNFKTIVANLYRKYKFLLDSSLLEEVDKNYFYRCLNKEEEEQLSLALFTLINMLRTYYNEQVIVLLDEYDVPIIEGYLKGYYAEVISFMREIFSSTFKNNLNLKKGIITGVLRVSKEGMFTGANNVDVYSMNDANYANYFGFLEVEVKEVLTKYNLSDKFQDVKNWYDGYLFNKNTIYNPWSILKFLKDKDHILQVHWANTGGVDLLRDIIYKNNTSLLSEFNRLLDNGYVYNVNLDLNMNLTDLNYNRNTVWTLFMLCGYLTSSEYNPYDENKTLKIPNLEIRKNLENICTNWFNKQMKGSNIVVSLVDGDLETFKKELTKIVLDSFSYYDVAGRNGENFYHAFVMGLLYSSNSLFSITSNRESGFGRYDLVLKPKNNSCRYAYVIEFKAISNNDFDKTIEDAFKQIDEKNYVESIKEYDVTKIVIVFKGKEIRIETRK